MKTIRSPCHSTYFICVHYSTSRKNNYFNFLNVPTEWDSLTRCTTTSTSSGKHVACGLKVTLHAFYKTSTQNYYIRSYFIESVLPYEKARNGISATLNFKICWWGGKCPRPPSNSGLRCSLTRPPTCTWTISYPTSTLQSIDSPAVSIRKYSQVTLESVA